LLQLPAVRNALPLLQQLQASTLLLSATTAANATDTDMNSTASSSSSAAAAAGQHEVGVECSNKVQQMLVHAQLRAAGLLYKLVLRSNSGRDRGGGLDRAAAEPFNQLMAHPAVTMLLTQLLTAVAAAMHQEHVMQTQQQEPQDAAASASDSSSSSSSSRFDMAVQQQQQKQLRADLLPIPAFHADIAPLLPAGRENLQTAAGAIASVNGTEQDRLHLVRLGATECVTALQHSLVQITRCAARGNGSATLVSSAPLLSPAGVKLMLQVQLLAAGRVQRQRRLLQEQRTRQRRQQQQQQQDDDDDDEGEEEAEEEIDPRELDKCWQSSLLIRSSCVLSMQIKTALHGSRSCLPPEVLQQAGLQLLQALAAPMQQRLLSKFGPYAETFDQLSEGRLCCSLLHTPYTLRAAAYGLGPASSECCGRACALNTGQLCSPVC
jgi:hypothetical protein